VVAKGGARPLSIVLVSAIVLFHAVAHAHPAGTSSVNRYLDFEYVGEGRFRVAYLLDFAEVPAYAEIDALDANHDGSVTPEEQERYLANRIPPLVSAWVVEIDGERARPIVVASHLDVLPGQGGETLRIECELTVTGRAPARGADVVLHVRDDTFADRPGWRDVREGEGLAQDAAARASGRFSGTDSRVAGGSRRVSDATFVVPSAAPSASSHAGHERVAAAAMLACLLAGLGATLRRRRASPPADDADGGGPRGAS
jgi:hypothetical protein